jgi:hypothetical protein
MYYFSTNIIIHKRGEGNGMRFPQKDFPDRSYSGRVPASGGVCSP